MLYEISDYQRVSSSFSDFSESQVAVSMIISESQVISVINDDGLS